MTSHLSFNSTSPEVYLWFFSNQIRGFDKPRVYYVSEKFRFQADWLAFCFSQSKWLSPQELSKPDFLRSVCSSNGGKWRAWGRLQSKLTVSTVLKRTLSSLLHRKGKLFFKYIKNHFSSIHFTCMSPNYWANYKWFWWTHQSTFNLRLRILAFIVLTWEVYKKLGVCIERHVRKTDEQEIPMTTVSWIS